MTGPRSTLAIDRDVPLASRTTFELGGAARYYCEVSDAAALREAAAWARERGVPLLPLGGGSNVIVPDEGVDALVVRLRPQGHLWQPQGERIRVRAWAGDEWDPIAADAAEQGYPGIEGLSGIPGTVGATPIQNVGAYGQEVAQTITAVEALDLERDALVTLTPDACEFSYRDSMLRRARGRYVVTHVSLLLHAKGAPVVRYDELARALPAAPSVQDVRDTVLRLRRGKSMILEAGDENRRSAGSFFTNPIVTAQVANAVETSARERALGAVPAWPQPDGRVKLAAGWLVERAGFGKGHRRGAFGISSRHALALVHHGGGRTRELLAFAEEIRATVGAVFGVTLALEPIVLGASSPT